MKTGVVNYYNSEKGFGFIKFEDENADDLFFHYSSAVGELGEMLKQPGATIELGTKVQFEEGEGRNGKPAATEVSLAEATDDSAEEVEAEDEAEEDMEMPMAA